jgi:hypothetical protein
MIKLLANKWGWIGFNTIIIWSSVHYIHLGILLIPILIISVLIQRWAQLALEIKQLESTGSPAPAKRWKVDREFARMVAELKARHLEEQLAAETSAPWRGKIHYP